MNTYQAVDQKKEDFREYLERNGIIDALTKVLVGLYEEPEKPDSPTDYIKQFLGGPSDTDTEALRHENEELRRKVDELQYKLDELTTATHSGPPKPSTE
ncbi:hypothetical protein BASA50_007318 [Batrachochytrium salamandrivorans]|uniref:c-Myc-binding protein n=1 Tax=Batrachochytrium salamandrivorans TaxID=1357716 RepID=A0ABQ8F7K1_9FUNG|nr:hypothetical protein BASA62_006193 [Batrachochytrium salamandrivorans]KAH6583907.1 hypothetical protein BASA60_001167 [Batrachochytrium salamandrivorans]KAH6589860.1 hypothetical protein BASA61_005466 [Batrachochytrium salamandrivorans]KAH6593508.1 hypothetical protein BASA50_007318 [Batrachochytrium salamandrivorans]KAH9248620.1 hypothetical protein BASA81_013690 [Batrachochytrium salamandrivorans]